VNSHGFASALASSFRAADADAERTRRRGDIMAAIGICLALRAMGDEQLSKLGETSPDLLTTAILTALDRGMTLDEATTAVVAAIDGGN
jgi:hypothetical protein